MLNLNLIGLEFYKARLPYNSQSAIVHCQRELSRRRKNQLRKQAEPHPHHSLPIPTPTPFICIVSSLPATLYLATLHLRIGLKGCSRLHHINAFKMDYEKYSRFTRQRKPLDEILSQPHSSRSNTYHCVKSRELSVAFSAAPTKGERKLQGC